MLVLVCVFIVLTGQEDSAAVWPVVDALSLSSAPFSSSPSPSPSSRRAAGPSKRKRVKVAIIGGGIAGLSCAQHLSSSSGSSSSSRFDVTVYDTGRLRAGGRCASRVRGDRPKDDDDDVQKAYPILSRYTFDHAAQVITVPKGDMFQDFATQVLLWKKQGVLQEFEPNTLFRIRSKNDIQPITSPSYFAPAGMASIPASMIDDRFQLQQDVWVSPSGGVRYAASSGQWHLRASGRSLGTAADQLVIAHNGKCADRLLSQTPAQQIHSLLRVNFSPTVPEYGGNRMTLNSIYSLTVCLPQRPAQLTQAPLQQQKPPPLQQQDAPGSSSTMRTVLSRALPDNFCCAYIDNRQCPSLRFLTCQTNKLKQANSSRGGGSPDEHNSNTNDDGGQQHEVWTILSSGAFAKQYKAAQEFLSEETIETVSNLLLAELEQLLGLPATSLSSAVVEKRLQLWGAAVPLNVWKSTNEENEDTLGFLYDSRFNVCVCGDWLVEASVAGAWTSGQRLAAYLLQRFSKDDDHDEGDDRIVGLDGSFVRSEKAAQTGIGVLDVQGQRKVIQKTKKKPFTKQ